MIAITVNFFQFFFVDCFTSCFFPPPIFCLFTFLSGVRDISILPLLRFALAELARRLPQVVVVGLFDDIVEAGD